MVPTEKDYGSSIASQDSLVGRKSSSLVLYRMNGKRNVNCCSDEGNRRRR